MLPAATSCCMKSARVGSLYMTTECVEAGGLRAAAALRPSVRRTSCSTAVYVKYVCRYAAACWARVERAYAYVAAARRYYNSTRKI